MSHEMTQIRIVIFNYFLVFKTITNVDILQLLSRIVFVSVILKLSSSI